MPTPSEMRLAIPKSPYEFESICLDYIKCNYPYSNAQQYGRQGQNQHGIDIYGGNFELLVQCKNYYVSASTNASQRTQSLIQQIKKDYNNAIQYFPKCKQFIVMTTFDRDTVIQDSIVALSSNVSVLFWDDIEIFLCTHPDIRAKYYYCQGFQIDIQKLNKMIAISNSLQTYADYFYSNSISNYAPFYNEISDNSMYDNYVSMYNNVVELTSLYNGIALQTMTSSIGGCISSIQSYIPNGYDDGGWGGHLLVLPEILRSFNSIKKLNAFKNSCKQLISEIQKLYSK